MEASDLKVEFAKLIMKHGAALTLAVAIIILLQVKEANQDKIYLDTIHLLREDKERLHNENKELQEKLIDSYKHKN